MLSAADASADTLALKPCDLPGVEGARCGSLTVPENPSKPEGRSIDLRVVVLDATGDSPQPDPIFFLAGGPGTAASHSAHRVMSGRCSLCALIEGMRRRSNNSLIKRSLFASIYFFTLSIFPGCYSVFFNT